MRILCTGGGTAGSIVPLLRLWHVRHKFIQNTKQDQLIWVTTGSAQDHEYIRRGRFDSEWSLPGAKWRRYWDWRTIVLPGVFIGALIKSLWICAIEQPHVVWTAGSFVAVPVAWAAWMLRIPVVTVQQDVYRGLANRLMEPIACASFTTLPTDCIANIAQTNYRMLGILPEWNNEDIQRSESNKEQLLLILGGSSGARTLNTLIWDTLPLLRPTIRVIHSIGAGKKIPNHFSRSYSATETIGPELLGYYQKAALVITRGGMNSIGECAFFSKACIVIPLPGTHQEDNSKLLEIRHAAVVQDQRHLTPKNLADTIHNLLQSSARRKSLGEALHRLFPIATESSLREFFEIHR